MKRLVSHAALCALLTMGLHAAPPPSPQDSPDPQSAGPQSSTASPAKRATPASGVPRLIKFAGTLPDTAGAMRAGAVGIQFAIYGERTGGAPLWQETQNVQLDGLGRYAVLLGSGREFPAGMFSNNEARWLGVQVLADAEPEQARVLLVSVPYALKAQDAETLGGRPASAYVLNEALGDAALDAAGTKNRLGDGQKAKSLDSGAVSTTGAHTVNAIPKFSATDTLSNSMMMELYNQTAADAFGFALPNEDVLRLGDGTGLPKSLHVDGRVVSKGFDMVTSAANSLHIVNTNTNGQALQANTEGTGFSTALFGSARSFNGAGLTAFSYPPIGGGTPAPADYSVAMYSGNYNQQGVGVHAWSAYDGTPNGDDYPVLTGPIGLYAAAAHSTGISAVLDHRAAGGGQLLSGRNDGTEVITMTTAGNITAAGSVTATSFSGGGAGLTGISAGNVACTGCISISELAFDPATQAELDAHKSSGDHDGRYAQLGAANAFSMAQTINADLTLSGSINGGLRVIADPTSPNVIGGHSDNAYRSGAYGMTIGGGGASGTINQVQDLYATVGGGENNVAGNSAASLANSGWATVGGGKGNNATGGSSTVAGGIFNTASSAGATVGGGAANSASGTAATVPGGQSNTASGFVSFAAGWEAHADHDRSFVWSDGTPTSSTAAQQFMARAQGGVQLITGGFGATGGIMLEPTFNTPNMIFGHFAAAPFGNAATSGVTGATISGGGHSNVGGPNKVTDDWGTVGGGAGNRAGDDAGGTNGTPYATVGGGYGNVASSSYAGVASGQTNTASGFQAFVGGGLSNVSSGLRSIIGGGNTNSASAEDSTVAGGRENNASAQFATIGGGAGNLVDGYGAAIAGGNSNRAQGQVSFVGGGLVNQATGEASTIPGGQANTAAGTHSFAAGRRARANHNGSFVWADPTDSDLNSSADNEFSIRAGGGFRFFDSGNTLRFSISSAGAVSAASFIGDGSGLSGISSSGLSCTGCVSASEVDFNFAASASQGGPASNSLQLGGVAASDYARIAAGNTFTALNTFSLIPAGASVGQGPLYVNPPSATADFTLLGIAVGGTEKLRVDAEGDVTARSAAFSGAVATAVDATASSSGVSTGVKGTSASTSGTGVRGDATAATGQTFGVHGVNASSSGIGVFGVSNHAGSATAVGVKGSLLGTAGAALYATASNSSGTAIAVHGEAVSSSALAGRFDLKANSGTILLARSGSPSLSDKFSVAADGSVTSSGSVTATSFSGSGAGLTGVSATVADGSITLAKLAFDPATQAELDTHKSSTDHDTRYVLKAGDTMTGALNLPANGLVAGTNQLVLASGNVGIGTSTPNMKLRIDNSANQGGLYLTQTNTVSSSPALNVYAEGLSTQNALIVESRVGGVDPYIVGLTVKTSGRVGIGTTSPAQKLDVVGNIAASGSVTATSFSGSGASLTGVATPAQLAALEAKLAIRGINYLAGCDSCNLLQVADSQKAIYMNVVGAMTINQVTCISDMGSPTINLQRDDGSAGNILSADLACSTGGTSTTAFLDSALAVSDKIDFYVTGGTGAAHRVTVVIKATLN